jgi:hypothetical protein
MERVVSVGTLLIALTFGERPAAESLDDSVGPTDGMDKWKISKSS